MKRFRLTRNKTAVTVVVILFTMMTSVGISVAAYAKGYSTDDTGLGAGMVVALSVASVPDNPKVERAALDKESKVIGVSTTVNDHLVTEGSASKTVYVQTTGETTVFVTDLNGDVKNGDLLAPSPILGILMKADASTAPIVGIAIENFDHTAAETQSIEGGDQRRNVQIDKIQVNLDHKAASNQQASATDSSLERLGRVIVGKDVGEIQVIAALVIFMLVLVAEGGIIYGAVSSAITALGRNPMAGKLIRKEMIRIVAIALMVLSMGIAAIYAILWI